MATVRGANKFREVQTFNTSPVLRPMPIAELPVLADDGSIAAVSDDINFPFYIKINGVWTPMPDGYLVEGLIDTEDQHHHQTSEAISAIRTALDGYTSIPVSGSSADGYIAFFTGASGLAGDNDLYWDRVNNKLVTGPTIQLGTATTKITANVDGSLIVTNDAESANSGIIYLGSATSGGVRISHSGNTFQIRDGAGLSTYVEAYQLFDSSGFSGYAFVAAPVGTYIGFSNASGDSRQNIDVNILRHAPSTVRITSSNIASQYLIAGFMGGDGYIGTDTGNLRLSPNDNIVKVDGYVIPETDDAYSLGTEENRWKELWLGPGSLHIKSNANQTETGVERDWVFGADANGDLVIRQETATYARFSNDRPVNLGTQATSSRGLVAGGVLIGGALEIDGQLWVDTTSTFGSTMTVQHITQVDSFGIFFAASSANHSWIYGNKTIDQLALVVGSEHGNQLVFASSISDTTDYNHPVQNYPTLFIHSYTDPAVDSNQWMSFTHRQVGGYIETGSGSVLLAPFDGYASPAIDDAYSLGSPSLRWKDIWLGPGTLHLVQSSAENDLGVNRDWALNIDSGGQLNIKQADGSKIRFRDSGELQFDNATVLGAPADGTLQIASSNASVGFRMRAINTQSVGFDFLDGTALSAAILAGSYTVGNNGGIFSSTGLTLVNSHLLKWVDTGNSSSGTPDLSLHRVNSNALGLGNGSTVGVVLKSNAANGLLIRNATDTAAGSIQANTALVDGYLTVGPLTFPATHSITMPEGAALAIYNTTDSVDYERGAISWSGNIFTIAAQKGGNGNNRATRIVAGDGSALRIDNFAGASIESSSAGFAFFSPFSDAVSLDLSGKLTSGTRANVRIRNVASGSAFSASLDTQSMLELSGTISQTGTAGYNWLDIAITESTTGSGPKRIIDAKVNGVSKFFVQNDGYVGATGTINSSTNILIAGATQIIDTGNKLSIRGDGGLAGGNAYFVATDSTDTITTYQGVTSSTGFTGTQTASPFEIRTSNVNRLSIASNGTVNLTGGQVWQMSTAVLCFTNSSNGHFWQGQTSNAQYSMGLGTELGRQIVVCDTGSYTLDFAHPLQQHPTFYFHSSSSPTQTTEEWMSISHIGSDGYIQTGKGNIILEPADGYVATHGQIVSILSTSHRRPENTITIDWNQGNSQIVDLGLNTGTVTLNYINARSGASYILKVIQHASAPQNITWPAGTKWPDGTIPTISTGANAVDIVSIWYDGEVYYSNIGQNYS